MNHRCSYSHKPSQMLLEQYLLNNLVKEYDSFCARLSSIQEKNKPKSNKRTPSTINAEMSRLNILFQKGRIDFDYYNEEYAKLETELQDLNEVPQEKADYSHIERILDHDFISTYNALTEENKQVFWHDIIKSITMKGKEIVAVDFRQNVSD